MGPGHTIATILCDGGAKYQSRLFNEAWIAERGFQDAIA
jgi:cysteine synthase A